MLIAQSPHHCRTQIVSVLAGATTPIGSSRSVATTTLTRRYKLPNCKGPPESPGPESQGPESPGPERATVLLAVPFPGRYQLTNAAFAVLSAVELGVELAEAAAALRDFPVSLGAFSTSGRRLKAVRLSMIMPTTERKLLRR